MSSDSLQNYKLIYIVQNGENTLEWRVHQIRHVLIPSPHRDIEHRKPPPPRTPNYRLHDKVDIMNRDEAGRTSRCGVMISARLAYGTPTGLICYTVRCPDARSRQRADPPEARLAVALKSWTFAYRRVSLKSALAHVSLRAFFFFTCLGDSQLSSGFSGGDQTRRRSDGMLTRLTAQISISMKNAHCSDYTPFANPAI